MCHDDDSRPPSAPGAGTAAEHSLITLTGTDGNTFAAYQSQPQQSNGKNIVILPDVRGLHPYYEQLAVTFAEAGFSAVAIDYFGRTNGVSERDDSFDWQTEIGKVQPDHVEADVRAASEYLLSRNSDPVFTVGFCFGGSQSWRLAASDLSLAGCMGFYGQPGRIADVESAVHHPMLLLVAGADVATPREDFEALDARLTQANKTHETYIYDGAPHSFFDRSFGEWHDACDDAWLRMLAFTDAHS
jgi:carboxymethylenebutenolidase